MLRFNSGGRFKPGLLLVFVLLFSLLSSFTLNSGLVAAGRPKGSKNKPKVATGEDPWLSGSQDTKKDKAVASKKGPKKCYRMKIAIIKTMEEQTSGSDECHEICQTFIHKWRESFGKKEHMPCVLGLPCVNGWSVSTDLTNTDLMYDVSKSACQSPGCKLPCTCIVQAMFWRIRQPLDFGDYASIPKHAMFGDPMLHWDDVQPIENIGDRFKCIPKFLLWTILRSGVPADSWHRLPIPEYTAEWNLSCDPTSEEVSCGCGQARGLGEDCRARQDRQGAHDAGQSSHEPGRDTNRILPFDLNQPPLEDDQSYQGMAYHFDAIREAGAYDQQRDTSLRSTFQSWNAPNDQQGYPYTRRDFEPMEQYVPQIGHDPYPYAPAVHFSSQMGVYGNDPQSTYPGYLHQGQYNFAPGQPSSGYGNDPQTNDPENQLPYLEPFADPSWPQGYPACYRTPDGGRNCGFR
ncbi:hypothetical protein BCR37DRAFT_377663 [Protomyces lactucae-debilis]|uniref:Uncharacterized protein n=1 Tax=Protomyces lactucae-debilis TaxID=2754530 RepID=A0A1Y2FLI8_PROLT|nr:uncharacterized protein BCR37DRAFT_377663 [Protomyces lactucae-debilis]ORY84833.1 hypothetical protein BCR37DRAFT_377663 [Protomyces lactucae-debilis]